MIAGEINVSARKNGATSTGQRQMRDFWQSAWFTVSLMRFCCLSRSCCIRCL